MPLQHCEIFCNVIDNYGDIGVSWRLARQLHLEHQLQLTLWVDDLASFQAILPALDPAVETQWQQGICVKRWPQDDLPDSPIGDLVIEAFGCRLPDSRIAAMSQHAQKPVWINLEYLSAEAWVEDCHGLSSPHPQLPITKYFFFPGFSPSTGGLPCERALIRDCQAWQADSDNENALWQSLGLPARVAGEFRISLFCYESASAAYWVNTLAQSAQATRLLVPAGKVLPDLAAALGLASPLQPGDCIRHGNLTLHILPMTDQQAYDRLLWSCDLNIVRGEDSFLRAQWAGKPMLWHIYRQEENAHLEKLEAFLGHYTAPLPDELGQQIRTWWLAWNQDQDAGHAWHTLLPRLPEWQQFAHSWPQKLLADGDLATRLVQFAEKRLQ